MGVVLIEADSIVQMRNIEIGKEVVGKKILNQRCIAGIKRLRANIFRSDYVQGVVNLGKGQFRYFYRYVHDFMIFTALFTAV